MSGVNVGKHDLIYIDIRNVISDSKSTQRITGFTITKYNLHTIPIKLVFTNLPQSRKFNPISHTGGMWDTFDWVRLVGLKKEEA